MSARVVKDGLIIDLLATEITAHAALDMISSPRRCATRCWLEVTIACISQTSNPAWKRIPG